VPVGELDAVGVPLNDEWDGPGDCEWKRPSSVGVGHRRSRCVDDRLRVFGEVPNSSVVLRNGSVRVIRSGED
jgi:hypothetical protein